MVFQTRARSCQSINPQKLIIFRSDAPALTGLRIHPRPIRRAVHHARDQVPLCSSLQILINDVARNFGKTLMRIEIVWRYTWASLPRFLPHRNAG